MRALIDRIARTHSPKAQPEAMRLHEAAALAGQKRAMERRLRAQGLSRGEAKMAVRLYFKAAAK